MSSASRIVASRSAGDGFVRLLTRVARQGRRGAGRGPGAGSPRDAGSVTDFDLVKQRLQSTWYSMDFQHGVKFDLTIQTGDSFTAATVSSLLTAAVMLRKMSGSEAEKQALSETSIGSDSGKLSIHFASSDSQFSALLQSPLFQSMVR